MDTEIERLKLTIKKLREQNKFQNQALMRKNKTVRMMNAAHKALMIERDQHAEQATLNATRWQECEAKLKKLSGEFNGMSLSLTLERDLLKRQVEELKGVKETIDLMRDEFLRIIVISDNKEIIGLCERAVQKIEQKVPLIIQLQVLQQDNDQLRAENAELRKDKERLAEAAKELLNHLNQGRCIPEHWYGTHEFLNRLRQAIDAAKGRE